MRWWVRDFDTLTFVLVNFIQRNKIWESKKVGWGSKGKSPFL